MTLRMPLKSLLVLGLLASASVLAADTAKAPAAPVPLLWKVSDKDNAVYLLGSFHLLRPGDYPLSPEVEAAFADAERLMFELAPEEMQSPAMPQMMLQAAELGLGTTYVGMFNPEKLLEQFPEMKGLQPTAYLPLGYPAETAHPSRLHADRKPLEELAVFL